MNLHAQLTDAAGAAARTVQNVHADQLGQPTPCTEWDVRELLNHLIFWTSYSLEARANGESASDDLMNHDFAADPGFAAGYRAQLDRALAAWENPAKPDADVLALNIAELVLHGWDLAVATGQRYAIDDATAAVALRAVAANAEMYRQYKGFADPVEVPADASPLDQVLGLSGRDPSLAPR